MAKSKRAGSREREGTRQRRGKSKSLASRVRRRASGVGRRRGGSARWREQHLRALEQLGAVARHGAGVREREGGVDLEGARAREEVVERAQAAEGLRNRGPGV